MSVIEMRWAGGRRVPEHTDAVIDELGLRVVADEPETRIVLGSTDRD